MQLVIPLVPVASTAGEGAPQLPDNKDAVDGIPGQGTTTIRPCLVA